MYFIERANIAIIDIIQILFPKYPESPNNIHARLTVTPRIESDLFLNLL